MSGKRSKQVRHAFELINGFTIMDRQTEVYRREWKKFKKNRLMGV